MSKLPELADLRRSLVQITHLLGRCENVQDLASTLRSHLLPVEGLTHSHRLYADPPTLILGQRVLPDSLLAGLVRTFTADHDLVTSCAFSPNGQWVAAGTNEGTVIIWNGQTGTIQHSFRVSDQAVNACAFTSDASELMTASSDLCWWDVRTGQLKEAYGIEGVVHHCAYSSDEHFAVFTVGDGWIFLWDMEQAHITSCLGHKRAVMDCAFSPHSDWMVSAATDGTLKVWSLPNLDHRFTLTGHTSTVRACTVSPDAKRIVSAAQDRLLKVWDAQTGQILHTLEGHSSTVAGCCFAGDWLVSVSFDRTMKVWDVSEGRLIGSIDAHAHYVHDCAPATAGQIITAAFDRTVRLWDISEVVQAHADPKSTALTCDVNALLALTGARDGSLTLWRPAGEQLGRLEGHSQGVSGCEIAASGRWCVSAAGDHTLRIWDVARRETDFVLQGHTDFVWTCAISADERWIASGSQDHTVRVWDRRTGNSQAVFTGTAGIMKVAFSPDARLIAAAAQDGNITLWAFDGGRIDVFTGHQGWVLDCTFSSDARFLLSASRDTTLKLWDIRARQAILTLRGHQSPVTACDFNPAGTRIVSVEENGALKLWDAASGRCLTTFYVDGTLNDCRFFPDGRRIMAVGSRGVYWLGIEDH